jgi:hypothetical protein
MKILIFPVMIAFSFAVLGQAKAQTAAAVASSADPEDGPFYVMDYDEFKKITKEQKSFYLGKLIAEIPKFSAIKDLSKDQILAAGKDETKWSEMEEKVLKACEDKSAAANCKSLQKARVDAFLRGASR